MRVRVIAFTAAIFSLIAGTAQGGNFATWGNDTGGIIPWSPAVDVVYREVAIEHCASYNKIAHITSVRRDYGEFIGFECLFDRNFDPIKGPAFHSRPDGR
jgi:hypothetical protein